MDGSNKRGDTSELVDRARKGHVVNAGARQFHNSDSFRE